MTYALFIDDERFPCEDGKTWHIARSMSEVGSILARHGMPFFISFDHDLGDDVPTGFDIAKAMVESDLDQAPYKGVDFRFSPDFSFYVHSQNPIGKANIEGILKGYMKSKFQ